MPSRRDFLRAAASSAVAAPFWNSLARAAGPVGPQNLLIFHSPNGTLHSSWRPTSTAGVPTFPAGGILQPLQPLAEHLILLDGLDLHGVTNHEGGMEAMLTNGSGGVTDGASLDQVIAAGIGKSSRFSSLELGVCTDRWGGSNQTRMSYAPGHSRVTPDDDPVSVYTRMYGDLLEDTDAAAARLARRLSVLDLVSDELSTLQGLVGTTQRQHLDAHLTAIREVELQLTTVTACQPGQMPESHADTDDSFPDLTALQLDLAVEALACEMTRVVSVQLSHTISPVVPTWLGLSDSHHTLSHCADSDTQGIQDFITAERWFAEQFGALIERLMAVETDTGTLLDQTMVLWAKELGDPRAHTCTDTPFILTGGGAFEGGRYLDLGGRPHAHMLVSICQAFGLPYDSFGNPDAGSGPLEVL